MGDIDWSATLKMWADAAHVAGVVGALIYFGYRFFIGYFTVNVSVTLDLARASSANADIAYVAVTVKLRKGEHGSMVLHDLSGRVSFPSGVVVVPFSGFFRVSYETDGPRGRACIDRPSASEPLLRLPPGEEAMYSAYAEVPAGAPCLVEVVVLGKIRGGRKFGQWRASAVSLPLPRHPTST